MESPNGYFEFPSPEPGLHVTLLPLLVLIIIQPPPPVPPLLLFETPAAVNEASPVITVPDAVLAGPIVTDKVVTDWLSTSLQ